MMSNDQALQSIANKFRKCRQHGKYGVRYPAELWDQLRPFVPQLSFKELLKVTGVSFVCLKSKLVELSKNASCSFTRLQIVESSSTQQQATLHFQNSVGTSYTLNFQATHSELVSFVTLMSQGGQA